MICLIGGPVLARGPTAGQLMPLLRVGSSISCLGCAAILALDRSVGVRAAGLFILVASALLKSGDSGF